MEDGWDEMKVSFAIIVEKKLTNQFYLVEQLSSVATAPFLLPFSMLKGKYTKYGLLTKHTFPVKTSFLMGMMFLM